MEYVQLQEKATTAAFKFVTKCAHQSILGFTMEVTRNLDKPKEVEDLHMQDIQSTWRKPLKGIWKLNTDGSCNLMNGTTACGGLIRDHKGEVIHGFATTIAQSNPLRAELLGMPKGLNLAYSLKPRELEVETDSREAYDLTAIYCPAEHPCADIVGEISRVASLNWVVSIHHVIRGANSCADKLAKYGHQVQDLGSVWKHSLIKRL